MTKLTKSSKKILCVIILTFLSCLYWFIICPKVWAHIRYRLEQRALLWMIWPWYTFWFSAAALFGILSAATYFSIRWYERYSTRNSSTSSSTTSTTQIVQSKLESDSVEMGMDNGCVKNELTQIDEINTNAGMNNNHHSIDVMPVAVLQTSTAKSEVFMYINNEDDSNNKNKEVKI